jgi:hypothetical protein
METFRGTPQLERRLPAPAVRLLHGVADLSRKLDFRHRVVAATGKVPRQLPSSWLSEV